MLRRAWAAVWVGLVLCGCPAEPARQEAGGVRVLELCWDDVGLARLGEPALTPAWARFTARADCARFTTFWGGPSCSPARAMRLTGRYPRFQSVPIGSILQPRDEPAVSLDPAEAMPRRLPGTKRHLGKWHLATAGQNTHPTDCGFDAFRGTLHNLTYQGGHYGRWLEAWSEGGASGEGWVRGYEPEHTTSLALAALDQGVDYVSVWTHLVHEPLHVPPEGLFDRSVVGDLDYEEGRLRAALMAADTLAGRLVDRALELGYVVIWWSDNGGTKAEGGKGSLFERSLRVPLAIAGPGVSGGTRDDLVSVCDLYPTVCELRGAPASTPDAVSLVPALGGAPHARRFLYCDRFPRNGVDPTTQDKWRRAIRGRRWKLVQRPNAVPPHGSLYDLEADPDEERDLLPGPLAGEARAAHLELQGLWP